MSSYISWEIIVEILSRLPVKSLLRFRCVSTSWLRLIDSSDFVKLHLDRSARNSTNLSLILTNHRRRLLTVDLDSLNNNTVPLVRRRRISHFANPRVCGASNGLVCLCDELNHLILWNPSTLRIRTLPHRSGNLASIWPACKMMAYGFGYDRVNDDYKVVRIVVRVLIPFIHLDQEVDAYSLKSNSWHSVDKVPHCFDLHLFNPVHGTLAGSAIHWVDVVKRHSTKINNILAFDLGTEEYRLVPQPEYSEKDYPVSLGRLSGCLSVICNDFGTCVDIWVMKDYGVKESWTKLVSLVDPLPVGVRSFHPLAYSNGGREILVHQYDNTFFWFSLKGQMVKTVSIAGFNDLLDIQTCLGSLVPLS